MTDDQRTVVFTAIVIGVVLLTLLLATLRSRSEKDAVTAVEIARIVERNASSFGAAITGLVFALATIFCFINFFVATTTDKQIVALLLWIANSCCWGVLLLANLITQNRTSKVFRDQNPPERQEPPL